MFKTLPSGIFTVLRSRRGQRNLRVLAVFSLVLVAMIVAFTLGFHYLMLREGQEHTWLTGLYWTLTVMSTLGFGDITFHTDLGRAFAILVLLSGMIFLLVLLPFTFIEFFYEPWMQAQAEARAPRRLPASTEGHVLLTHYDPVTAALIRRLEQFRYRYAVIVPDLEEALRLHDLGVDVLVGDLDDPECWRRARVDRAALVATTGNDVTNTHVAFTVREIAERVPIVSTATHQDSVDVQMLAGSKSVLRLEEMIGQSFSRRMLGGDALAHVIGRFDEILIAEATAFRTPLVGKTLLESDLRRKVGVSVLGVWERGTFEAARPDTTIHDHTVLVLACTKETLDRYNELLAIYNVSGEPALILGGGRVGRATARALATRGVEYRIVEKVEGRVKDPRRCVVGDAADLDVLKQAGVEKTPTIIITTRDDDVNVYLAVYCRRLRPNVQIIARATHDRNVSTLHRAGADMVLSYASMGAGAIMDMLKKSEVMTVVEGLDLFRAEVSKALAGKTIAESSIREETGCSVVGIRTGDALRVVPEPETVLEAGASLILIGTSESEQAFFERFSDEARGRRSPP
ncbi:MAG: potassium channel family protein [Planctomycetota bacterium JB042]